MSHVSETKTRQFELRSPAVEIEQEIQSLIASRSLRASAYGPQFVELWQLTAQCFTGGKLLRPRLLMGAFDALLEGSSRAIASRAAALEIAAAIELLHFSFLLHDDVIDEDLHRRGAPNLIGHLLSDGGSNQPDQPSRSHRSNQPNQPNRSDHASTRAADNRRLHWARSSGILVGDLMLTVAHQAFARVNIDQDCRLRLLDLLDHAVTETVAGEHCDVGLGDGLVASDLNIVLDMTRMKTATYTVELPLRAAAILMGADARLEQQLGAIGRHLGVAFQLQDDLLSAFGESNEHGKDPFSDFREGKETAIIAYARMTSAWPNIEPLLGADGFSDEHGPVVQQLLAECGAEHFIRSMAQDQLRAALEILSADDSVIPPAACRFILQLVDSLDGRVS